MLFLELASAAKQHEVAYIKGRVKSVETVILHLVAVSASIHRSHLSSLRHEEPNQNYKQQQKDIIIGIGIGIASFDCAADGGDGEQQSACSIRRVTRIERYCAINTE